MKHLFKTILSTFFILLVLTTIKCKKEINIIPDCYFVTPIENENIPFYSYYTINIGSDDSNNEINNIIIYINGEVKAKLNSKPYKYVWETGGFTIGQNSISMKVSNDAGDHYTKSIDVNIIGTAPKSYIGAEQTMSYADSTINFIDLSTNAPIEWLWDFGDGNVSNEQDPSHIYETGGKYTITLTTSNEYGSDVQTKSNYISVNTITDIDNNKYNFVDIGSQTWLQQNLKVTKFNDGTPVTNITDVAEWPNFSGPAYCWYENDSATYAYNYGALYNGYVISDKNICPAGWHIPSIEEWDILENHLGGYQVAGDKLKTDKIGFWLSSGFGTNESKFSALPGGVNYAGFLDLGWDTYFMTSNNDGDVIDLRQLSSHTDYVIDATLEIFAGVSIRCIKD